VLGVRLTSVCRTCRPAVAYMVLKRRMLPGPCVLFTWLSVEAGMQSPAHACSHAMSWRASPQSNAGYS